MASTPPSTWLIIGASSGFGKSLASEALRSGYKVIGTTRDINKAEISFPHFSPNGGIWVALEPAQKDAFDQFTKVSQEYEVDVRVNNAGYAFIGGVEDTRSVIFCMKGQICLLMDMRIEDEVRDQMKVNFYGPLRAVRVCLPVMRAKGSGNIVLISSGAGYVSSPVLPTQSPFR